MKVVFAKAKRAKRPTPKPVRADPAELNKYLMKMTERTLGNVPDNFSGLVDLVSSMTEHVDLRPSFQASASVRTRSAQRDNSTQIGQFPWS